jgi:RNA recognition motif-containing protein
MSIDPFSGRNPSYCFVDLASTENASAVIQKLKSKTIRGRPLKVNYDSGKRDGTRRRHIETRTQKGGWQAFDFKPPQPSDTEPLVFDRYARNDARDHWTKPIEEGRRLFVGGLSAISSQTFVNAEMQDLFEGFDMKAVSKPVVPAHLDKPSTGQCFCFVDFATAEEAKAAMAHANGAPTPYSGRYRVKFARDQETRKVCREQAEIIGKKTNPANLKRKLEGNWRSNA